MARNKSTSTDYAVGYKRPPKASQFKPGQSGNPKGRPKGSRSIGMILQEVFQQRISTNESGKSIRRTVLETILRGLARDAMRGDASAIKLSFLLLDRYAESSPTAPTLNELLDEDAMILSRYLPRPHLAKLKSNKNKEGDNGI